MLRSLCSVSRCRTQLARLGPGFGGDFGDLAGGHAGKACEHIAQVAERVQAAAAAAFDDGVEDVPALAGIGSSDEQPVLFAKGGGADGVFHQVVVDLYASVAEEAFERGPSDEGQTGMALR